MNNDLIGKRFGRLVVVEEGDPYISPKGHKSKRWICKCDCGNTTSVQKAKLVSGQTLSCGCYIREKSSVVHTTHGLSKHPLLRVWSSMINRCSNPNNEHYSYYGGRGISVWEGWRKDVKIFIGWCVANGWKEGLQIDRINNDGNYEPDNIRFVSRSQNQMNTRSRRGSSSKYKGVSWVKNINKWMARITLNGKTKCLGCFETEEEAALAYNKAASEIFGEHAYLNLVREV